MPPARAAVYAALVTTAVVVCAIALTTWGIAGEQSNRVEELNTMLKRRSSGFPARAPKFRRAKRDFHPNFTPPKVEPQVQIDIKDLVKMNPLWAPTAEDKLSKGFNSWMDTLPFGDNFHKHLQEKKEKQIWVEKERLENPHFLLRRVEANNAYLTERAAFLDKLVTERRDTPGTIQIDIVHPGPQGDIGRKGPRGQIGPPGFMGPRGPQGPPGVEGDMGPKGDRGVEGPTGLAGDRGVQGPMGPVGAPGPRGLPGADGPAGDTGAEGPRGPSWPTVGPPGPPGPPGLSGPIGVQGLAGLQGPPGGAAVAPLRIQQPESMSGAPITRGFLNAGSPLYIDKPLKFKSVPAPIAGQPYIMTADSDKGRSGTAELKFTVNRPCYVYVLRDIRGTAAEGGQPPAWLGNGFIKLDDIAKVDVAPAWTFAVYRSAMPMSGQITLGGNAAPPSIGYQNNYVVAVAPAEEHRTEGVGVVALSIPSETGGTEAYEGAMGFSFTVNAPVFILDLGVFNPLGSAPLPGALSCRLYNMQTGELLAQQAFTEENRGDLQGGSLFKALRQPVQLPAGFKGVLAADGYGPNIKNGNSEGAAPAWTFNNDGGKVTFGGDALFGAKGEMPTEVAGPPGNRFAAATMRFT